jgi:NADH-quinone oxidoreductase subunit L
MVTHAFFKALMFLGSGSVIHGMHEEQDMRRMGALRKYLPITAATFIVGWLSIAGVPPFSGFWSKDDILLYAWDKSPVLWAVGLVTALLTAYYMTRQVVMVFFGDAKWQEADPVHDEHSEGTGREDHGPHGAAPHESPWVMLFPLVVLAALAAVGGGLNLPFTHSTELLSRWLDPVVGEAERQLPGTTDDLRWVFAAIATVGALVGLVLGWLVYSRRKLKAVEPEVLAEGWYYDKELAAFAGGPGRRFFDLTAWFDRTVVDGIVNGAARTVRGLGQVLRRSQTGFVRTYAAGLGLGAVALLVWFVLVRGVIG